MNNNQPDNQSQEIDLSSIQKTVSSSLRTIKRSFFCLLGFVFKNIIVLLILVVIGVSIGYYLDHKVFKSYKHEVIIIPNIENKSYLYKAVENFEFMPIDASITNVSVEPLIDLSSLLKIFPTGVLGIESTNTISLGIL